MSAKHDPTILGLNSARTRDGRRQLDGSACIYDDGRVLAVPEERLSLVKHDGGLEYSLRLLTKELNIRKNAIDLVVVSTCGEASLKSDEPIFVNPNNALTLHDIGFTRAEVLPIPSHHLSHASLASVFACSNKRSLISIYDFEGSDGEVNSHYLCENGELELLEKDRVSVEGCGGVGSAVHFGTGVVGLDPWRDGGNFCGLASSTSEEMYLDGVVRVSDVSIHGCFPVNRNGLVPQWLGNLTPSHFSAFARAVQKQVEVAVLTVTQRLVSRYGVDDVILGGGVANNCKLIGFLQDNLENTKVKTSFAPGDSGQSIGNVIWGLRSKCLEVTSGFNTPFLTPHPQVNSEKIVESDLEGSYIKRSSDLVERSVQIIETGGILATFIGRAEFGPRALGARSFLIRSDNLELSNYLNSSIKQRETYRPFGIIVNSDAVRKNQGSPFMDRCASWKNFVKSEASLSGCRSADGSIRYQTTSSFTPNFIIDIVEACKSRQYRIINTSLNGPNQPTIFEVCELIDLMNKHPKISVLMDTCLFESNI